MSDIAARLRRFRNWLPAGQADAKALLDEVIDDVDRRTEHHVDCEGWMRDWRERAHTAEAENDHLRAAIRGHLDDCLGGAGFTALAEALSNPEIGHAPQTQGNASSGDAS
jgi:hypothetical protein